MEFAFPFFSTGAVIIIWIDIIIGMIKKKYLHLQLPVLWRCSQTKTTFFFCRPKAGRGNRNILKYSMEIQLNPKMETEV